MRASAAVMPETRERSSYADSVGFIRVKEKRDLLNRARLQEYLSLPPDGILDRLGQAGAAVPGMDALLGSILNGEYADVARFDHERLAVPVLRYRHDVHNTKALLRKRSLGSIPRFSPVEGNFHPGAIEASLAGGASVPWPEPIDAALAEIQAHAEGHYPGDRADVALDAAWLEYARRHAVRAGLALMTRYFLHLADFAAVRFFWKKATARRYGYEVSHHEPRTHFLDPDILGIGDRERLADALLSSIYGQSLKEGLAEWKASGSWALLDRDMDNYLCAALSGAKYLSMGPEPLCAFLLAKENDLKNIRLLYVLRGAGWPDREVKIHLRKLYG